MLGAIGDAALFSRAQGPWTAWTSYIMKQKKKLGFKQASLVKFNGSHVASTSGIVVTETELTKLHNAFFDVNTNNNNSMTSSHRNRDVSGSLTDDICETLTLRGKTYIVKSHDNQQIVAFNGSKCYVITKTKTMYIIVLTDNKSKREEASHWLRNISCTFTAKGY